ncbi:MAG: Sarcosine oxidase gamma subunit [uncultured Actinomycetospora sp.]|uniref:Sarcosine oxidase gamma subunit n=1 Tax=uncultured Actinomycetospora sp. TaxID=1135996 RepID=A0A6J4INP0_9PSEU|nr:MAG: Sarcosine oxidase gamma subunit [uncultured Actinomycetospora sp.]
MAEIQTATLTARHPLEGYRDLLEALSAELAPALALELGGLVAAVDLRVDPAGGGPAAVEQVVGGPLPTRPDTWTALPAGQALRLGPDEWLLTSAAAQPEDWEFAVDEAAAAHGGMAVDVSAQRTALRLRGGAARELLTTGCALDLRPRSFPHGRCAQTLFGQAAVVLVAHGGDDLQVLVRPSFAAHVVDRLVDAATEYRPDPSPESGPASWETP